MRVTSTMHYVNQALCIITLEQDCTNNTTIIQVTKVSIYNNYSNILQLAWQKTFSYPFGKKWPFDSNDQHFLYQKDEPQYHQIVQHTRGILI